MSTGHAPAGTTSVEPALPIGTTDADGAAPPHDATPELPPWPDGLVLHQRYRIEKPLGQGGMGAVYRAHDLQLGRDVAVKRLPPESWPSGTALQRFEREMRTTASLAHPNVVVVHDWKGPDEGGPYLVLELVQGETLAARLERLGRLAPEEAVSIVRQVLDALAAMHPEVVHRDLKPQNLIVYERPGTGEPFVKVLDFGVARARRGEQLTSSGSLIGTLAYMSPEALQGEAPDAQQDLWALAVVLYECLVGRVPFALARSEYASDVAYLFALYEATRAGLGDAAALPAPYRELLMRWLHAERARRPASATQALAELAAVTRAATTAPRLWQRRGFSATLTLLSALLVLLALPVALAPNAAQPSAAGFRPTSSGVEPDALGTLLARMPRATYVAVADLTVTRASSYGAVLDAFWRSGPPSRFGAGRVDDPRRVARSHGIAITLGATPTDIPELTTVVHPGLAAPSLASAWATDLLGAPTRRAGATPIWVDNATGIASCVTTHGDFVDTNAYDVEAVCAGLGKTPGREPSAVARALLAKHPALVLLADLSALPGRPPEVPSEVGIGLSWGSVVGPKRLAVHIALGLSPGVDLKSADAKDALLNVETALRREPYVRPADVDQVVAAAWQFFGTFTGLPPPRLDAIPAAPLADFVGTLAKGASREGPLLELDGLLVDEDGSLGRALERFFAAMQLGAVPEAPKATSPAPTAVPPPEIVQAAASDSDAIFPLCDTQVGRVLMGDDAACRARAAAESLARRRFWLGLGLVAALVVTALVAWRTSRRRRALRPALFGALVALVLMAAALVPRAAPWLRGGPTEVSVAALAAGEVSPGSYVRVQGTSLDAPVTVAIDDGSARREFQTLVQPLDVLAPEVLAPGHAGLAVPVMLSASDERGLGLLPWRHLARADVACAGKVASTTLEALTRLGPASVEGVVIEVPAELAALACQGEPRTAPVVALGKDALVGATSALGIAAGASPPLWPVVLLAALVTASMLVAGTLWSTRRMG